MIRASVKSRFTSHHATARIMWNRASVGNLILSLVVFLAFMVVLVTALGFGVGVVELTIWLVALIV
ncbi:MAG TPA: hypothetical protein VMT27_00455, partial [Actinomycetes bacterium]|nr:hypothetical protein [Actinomycetes bacterium]